MRDDRIIPAHAGNTCEAPGAARPLPDHPRARGEHAFLLMIYSQKSGSSPRTRGTHRPSEIEFSTTRIIPAHAGNTCSHLILFRHTPDHPRARGEHAFLTIDDRAICGSSPRTRGTLECCAIAIRHTRIIPAHAGNTRLGDKIISHTPDHPRARGEHSARCSARTRHIGSSPRTRGTRASAPFPPRPPRIIPAHAGNTSTPAAPMSAPTDHPRARGEHASRT